MILFINFSPEDILLPCSDIMSIGNGTGPLNVNEIMSIGNGTGPLNVNGITPKIPCHGPFLNELAILPATVR